LKDDADLPQALRGVLANIHAEDADYAFALEIEPGGEGEQGRFPGTVEAEQYGEIAGGNRKRDLAQYPARPEAVPEPCDRECRNLGHRRGTPPQGDCPTGRALTPFAATSPIT